MAVSENELAAYVEELAVYYEKSGIPRIGGRVLGHLLVCDPAHRSAGQLVSELGASKASISNMLRLFEATGIIRRVGVPGERATYYALAQDGFERKFEANIQTLLGFQPMAERGLELLRGEAPARTARLREMTALYTFWKREMPALINKWRSERERLIAEIPGGEAS